MKDVLHQMCLSNWVLVGAENYNENVFCPDFRICVSVNESSVSGLGSINTVISHFSSSV